MRIGSLAFVAFAAAPVPHAAIAAGPVDLSRPGILDAIRDQDPQRHERLSSILRAASEGQCRMPELERFLVRHDAHAASCSATLMTSYPPKRRLSFFLEDTHYAATIPMSVRGFGLQPAEK